MEIENQWHGNLAAQVGEPEAEGEGDPGDGLRGIQISVKEAVAYRGPTGLAVQADVQAVFFENSGLLATASGAQSLSAT